jgi:hypothetical protein
MHPSEQPTVALQLTRLRGFEGGKVVNNPVEPRQALVVRDRRRQVRYSKCLALTPNRARHPFGVSLRDP